MKTILGLGVMALVVMSFACGGGGDKRPFPTATAGVTATATPLLVATTIAVPAEPSALADYGDAIARYLSDEPAAAESCLAALFDAWNMEGIDPGVSCRRGNIDTDTDDEIVVALSGPQPEPGAPVEYEAVAFDRDGATWRAVYQSAPSIFAVEIAAVGVRIGDGAGAFAYVRKDCGAHTCTDRIFVLTVDATGARLLTQENGFIMRTATFEFRDADGEGIDELIAHGGAINSVGTGPNRLYTDAYAYDGATYVLTSSVKDPPEFLYHAILDADALFAAGQYADAEKAYIAAINDPALADAYDRRAELQGYALYRAGVAVIVAGADTAAGEAYLQRAIDESAGTWNAQLAGVFLTAYRAKGSVGIACAAVNDHLAQNADAYRTGWDFGYGNPPFDAAQVCPL